MSIDAKRQRAEALQEGLRALRLATEAANQESHDLVTERLLDEEIVRLEAEIASREEVLTNTTGDGSAADAIAAMTAAATEHLPVEELEPVSAPDEGPEVVVDENTQLPSVADTGTPASDVQTEGPTAVAPAPVEDLGLGFAVESEEK